jgi:hypothetical protein
LAEGILASKLKDKFTKDSAGTGSGTLAISQMNVHCCAKNKINISDQKRTTIQKLILMLLIIFM